MKLGRRNAVAVAATGIAVLSIDLFAVLGLSSLVGGRTGAGEPEALVKAGRTVARTVGWAARVVVSRAAGDAVLYGVRGLSTVYGAILRITPGERKVRYRAIELGAFEHPTVAGAFGTGTRPVTLVKTAWTREISSATHAKAACTGETRSATHAKAACTGKTGPANRVKAASASEAGSAGSAKGTCRTKATSAAGVKSGCPSEARTAPAVYQQPTAPSGLWMHILATS